MHIIKSIKKIIKKRPVLFTTPGHFQGVHTMKEFTGLYGKKLFTADLAEIQSMDNLQNPQEGILKSLEKTSGIYGSKASFYLINGSSSGIIALTLATVKRGEKILIARNAHKSAVNALILSGADPVWIDTEWEENWNIPSFVKPEKVAQKLMENPDIKAVWITSPTYEGIVSDIKTIADVCRKNDAFLLIDEAHGALWNFSDRLPLTSIAHGADACVQSLHKTGSCLNQGAVLHIGNNSRLTPKDIQSSLNIINTTSPSYILLSSIEASIEYLNSEKGRKQLDNVINSIEKTKIYLKKNTSAFFLENTVNYIHDPMKMFFGLKNIDGFAFSEYLENKFNIETELSNNCGILALTGIGAQEKHFEYLIKAVKKASKKLGETKINSGIRAFIAPKVSMSPAEAFNKDFKEVPIKNAVGQVSWETIVKYPPGIPVIISGEIVQQEHLSFFPEEKYLKTVKNRMRARKKSNFEKN